ncbi:MAG: hypothetical protein QE263_07255 [Vampirovibrionales bacterium]|nr:hypothetical protein [Vampirovibrionales bacterium]
MPSVTAQLNHWIARQESKVGTYQVFKSKAFVPWLAPLGIGLGVAATAYDVAHAPTYEQKHKVMVRDTLTMLGTVLGSWLAFKINTPRESSAAISDKRLPTGWGWADAWYKKITKSDGVDHAHSIADNFLEATHKVRSPLNRLKALFESPMHSHMGKALLKLGVLSFVPIFLGGIPFGALADKINGENLGQTVPMKLKEGIFQWVGNIMFCTLSIWAMAKGSRAAVTKLWEASPKFQRWIETRVTSRLARMAEAFKASNIDSPPLGGIPTGLTTPLAYRIRNFKHQPASKLIESLENHFFNDRHHMENGKLIDIHYSLFDGKTERPLIEKEWSALKQWLTDNHTTAKDTEKLKRLQHFYGLLAEKDLTGLMLNKANTVANLSLTARDALGDVIGAVSGVAVGIFGGAVVSNTLNSVMSNVFGLPKTHEMTGLFSKVHNHHGQPKDGDGIGAGALGTRGIHWWDAGMHLDDLPTALYMAGMHVIESAIQLLYGMSGFMAGNAGTNYTVPQSHNHPPALTPQQIAARFKRLSQQ